MKIPILLTTLILFVSCKSQNTTVNTTNHTTTKTASHDLSMFPKTEKNQIRHLINLEKTKNEETLKVEFYVGKTTEIDCNKSTLTGDFKKEIVSGWGYSFYSFNTEGHIISTKMMCPEDSKHKGFVASISEIIRYNSKLPIIIYTPIGYEVRYKIWSRNDNEQTAILK